MYSNKAMQSNNIISSKKNYGPKKNRGFSNSHIYNHMHLYCICFISDVYDIVSTQIHLFLVDMTYYN